MAKTDTRKFLSRFRDLYIVGLILYTKNQQKNAQLIFDEALSLFKDKSNPYLCYQRESLFYSL